MPEIICTTVYRFPELSEAAKEKARTWYRELGPHDDWWDAVYEDFERVCEILGIRLKTTPVRLMGGGTRAKPCIWFSGFWSQGDGACFEGYWSHAKGAAALIRDYAPTDVTLHGIADRLQAIQRRNFYQLAAEVMVDRAGREKLIGDDAVLAVEIEHVKSLDRAADGERAIVQQCLPAADDRVLAEIAAEDVAGLEDDGFFLGSHGGLADWHTPKPPALSGRCQWRAC